MAFILGKEPGIGLEFEQYRYYEPGDDRQADRLEVIIPARKAHESKNPKLKSSEISALLLVFRVSMNYVENGLNG